MNAVTKHEPQTAVTNNPLMPADMNGAIRLAEMMATGKLVPQHLQRQPGDCLMVIEQAMRWGMSPFAVAQSTSVISGKLMFEGKLVAAALQSSGILSGRINYEFEGEGETRAVVVSATLRGESEPRSMRVALKEVRTTNQMWTKQPDQQLVYSANRAWARRFAPEVMLGVYSPEEFEAEKPRDTFAGQTIEARAEPAPKVNDAATAHDINDSIPALDDGPQYPFATNKGGRIYRTGSEWMEAWRRTVDACVRTNAPEKLAAARDMNKGAIDAVADFDPQAAADVTEMLDAALNGVIARAREALDG